MNTVKKLFKYVILLIVFYIITDGLIWLATYQNRQIQTVSYSILTKSPVIAVEDCETSSVRVRISGTIQNDTKELIDKCYLRFDLFDENTIQVATEYKEIKYLNVDEKLKFNEEFSYKNISSIEISLVNEKK